MSTRRAAVRIINREEDCLGWKSGLVIPQVFVPVMRVSVARARLVLAVYSKRGSGFWQVW